MNPKTTILLPLHLLAAAWGGSKGQDPATREALTGAHIDADGRCLVVTNGTALATIPIPGKEPIKPGYLSPDLWARAKACLKKGSKAMPYDYASGLLNDAPVDPHQHLGAYPDYRAVIPDYPSAYRILIKPVQLAALAKAMGTPDSDTVQLDFDTTGKAPVTVRFGEINAVLMPGDPGNRGVATGLTGTAAAVPERSDKDAAADVKVIDDLRSALFQERARVKELEATLATGTAPPHATPPVKPLDTPRKGKRDRPERAPVAYATTPPVVTFNKDKEGIELAFQGKPDDATRLSIKARGGWWHRNHPAKPWILKYSEENWLFAQNLATGSAYTPMPEDAPEEEPAAATPPAPSTRVRNITLPDF